MLRVKRNNFQLKNRRIDSFSNLFFFITIFTSENFKVDNPDNWIKSQYIFNNSNSREK